MFCAPNTDVAVAGRGAAGIEGQWGDVRPCSCSGIEAVDFGAARIVNEVGLGTADEMSQLEMCYGDLGRIVCFRGQHKGVCVST